MSKNLCLIIVTVFCLEAFSPPSMAASGEIRSGQLISEIQCSSDNGDDSEYQFELSKHIDTLDTVLVVFRISDGKKQIEEMIPIDEDTGPVNLPRFSGHAKV